MERLTLVLLAFVLGVAATACGGGGGNVFSLEAGDCFDLATDAGEELSNVPIVDCDEPHDAEVFYVYDLPDGDYPADIDARTEADCINQFEGYVGSNYTTSRLIVSSLRPTSDGWDAGDQEVVCVLFLGTDKMTGSQKGTGI